MTDYTTRFHHLCALNASVDPAVYAYRVPLDSTAPCLPVPEPSAVWLAVAALVVLAWVRRTA